MTPPHGQQADHLRSVAQGIAGERVERLLVVLGAKGGVGASAVSLAVASDLARALPEPEGVAVLAIDARWGRDDLAVMASFGERLPAGLALTTASKLGVPPAHGEGAPEAARRLVRAARRWTHDSGGWVVIDAGGGDDPWARELAARAAQVLLVSTPDQVAAVNCYLTLKRLGPGAERVALVANHCDEAAARALQASLARSCERFLGAAPPLAGWLPTLDICPAGASITSAAA